MGLLGLDLLIYYPVGHLDLMAYYYLNCFLPWGCLSLAWDLEIEVLHLGPLAFLVVIVDWALEIGNLRHKILRQKGRLVYVDLDFELGTFYLNQVLH